MSHDKLVYMANQIGKFFSSQGAAKAPAGIAEHLTKFWDPRMRAAIIAHFEGDGAGLDPVVRDAVGQLRALQHAQAENTTKTAAHPPGATVLQRHIKP
jgi:formate dehydrogenase subunit delta